MVLAIAYPNPWSSASFYLPQKPISQSVSVTHVLAWTTGHTHSRNTGHYTRGVVCVLRERHHHRQKYSQRGSSGDPHSRPRERLQRDVHRCIGSRRACAHWFSARNARGGRPGPRRHGKEGVGRAPVAVLQRLAPGRANSQTAGKAVTQRGRAALKWGISLKHSDALHAP